MITFAKWAVPLALTFLSALSAMAQKTASQGIDEYRAMLADGNPAELFEAKGEDLWKKVRGPKNASLEKCDLGKGPGVSKGAFVELPRFFADTQRVQDLESRLVTCMEALQGFDGADITKTPFGRGEQINVTALATWIASESKGQRFNLSQNHQRKKPFTKWASVCFTNAAEHMIFRVPRVMPKKASGFVCRICPC